MRSTPFARFRAVMAAIAAAISGGMHHAHAVQVHGGYQSRGKGKGRNQASSNTTAQAKRAAVKAKNRAKHRRLA